MELLNVVVKRLAKEKSSEIDNLGSVAQKEVDADTYLDNALAA
jgi:hypothetical protein